jgi:hypothetical protein
VTVVKEGVSYADRQQRSNAYFLSSSIQNIEETRLAVDCSLVAECVLDKRGRKLNTSAPRGKAQRDTHLNGGIIDINERVLNITKRETRLADATSAENS